jgi:hypothetical protein
MIFDLTKPVEKSSDLAVLHALLTALLGQRCLKVDLSYGDELMLHIGEPVPYKHPKLADEQKGSWILGTRASGWRLLLNDPPVLIECGWFPDELSELVGPWANDVSRTAERRRSSGEAVEQAARHLAGQTVRSVRPERFPLPTPAAAGLGLVVDFAGGSSLAVVPSPERDEGEDPLADWELFTPFHTYLRVGPGLEWAYLRSDAPAKTA